MKSRITIVFIIVALFNSMIVNCQNIFDTTTIGYYGPDLREQSYVPTKFETYIKFEVEKTLHFTNKIILANFWSGGMVPEYTDTTFTRILKNQFILLSYSTKNEWTATNYLELSETERDSTTFLKSGQVKLPENSQLLAVRNNWDSLKNDWYLPFVSELELNGTKGYFPSSATDMGYVKFYAIDSTNVVYRNIYENDLSKEWRFPDIYIKNVNFDYNYSQPTFAVIIYLRTLFVSKTFFAGYKAR